MTIIEYHVSERFELVLVAQKERANTEMLRSWASVIPKDAIFEAPGHIWLQLSSHTLNLLLPFSRVVPRSEDWRRKQEEVSLSK